MRLNLAKAANKMIPGMTFSMAGMADALYLTFDDGPHRETTPRLLELLGRHQARATFFCLGRNAEKHPVLIDSIISEGHAIGNHSWSHPNGWLTGTGKYMADVGRASGVIASKIFRPPYGRITPAQYMELKKHYKIIMWTRQFADYRPGFNPSSINLEKISGGEIIVMHDSPGAISNTTALLERLLNLKTFSSFMHGTH
jgi:peptidoglycan-N-acetylglucosamine deacetylase